MKTEKEIQDRIKFIDEEKGRLMFEYSMCEDESEQGILAHRITEKSIIIKHLNWVIAY